MSELETIKSWMMTIDTKLEKIHGDVNDRLFDMNSTTIKNSSDILKLEDDVKKIQETIEKKPTEREIILKDGISGFIKTLAGLFATGIFVAVLNIFGISLIEFLKALVTGLA